MAQWKKLFEPITIGKVQAKNRILMLALATCYVEDGQVNERLRAFYRARAEGGAGIITVGVLTPIPGGIPSRRLGVYHDGFIPGLKGLVSLIHASGGLASAQIAVEEGGALGAGSSPEHFGPSPAALRRGQPPPHGLSVEEIAYLVDAFGQATARAREAGFDMVELHAGIGFLINRFLSPVTNKRTDSYGGSLENRMRFLMEVLQSAQRKAGGDYTLICRISGEEFMEGGMTLKETAPIAQALEKAGVRALNVQAGWHESSVPLVQMSVPRGAFVYVAEGIKKAVHIPVVAAYRINDPVLADQILAEGKADLIGMGRPLVADPELPNKAREGRLEDIRTCIACNRCLDDIFEDKPMTCAINAQAGREAECAITRASRSKKVVVVGGGPAGMEAARVAALRGHQVTLLEGQGQLGGNLLLASAPPHKEEINSLTRYLSAQLHKLSVRVRLGQQVTAGSVLAEKPEAVIVATGASPIIPDIPGTNGRNVTAAAEVLAGRRDTGPRVVIIGGGMVGCETAEFLAEKGKTVTVLEMLPRLGQDIGLTTRWVVLGRLRKLNVRQEAKATAAEVTEKGVRATRDGESLFFEGDTVVLAVGMKPRAELASELQGKVKEVHAIGDCQRPRRIAEAIEEGLRAALRL